MYKQKALLSALLLCFAGLSAFPQDSPLKVEVKLAQTAVKSNVEFLVSMAIINTTNEEQFLKVWACGFSDRKSVV